MYLDAMEFLEEERDAWAEFEALAGLSDSQLSAAVDGAHGWSGRDLMAHLLAWQEVALETAKELAVNETSPTIARVDADWEARGGEVVNDEITRTWAAMPMDLLRDRFRTQPGELRGYLTVVPETRWLKHATHLKSFHDETIAHYEEHVADLRAILAAAAGS
ncbi:MAG: maleylpyruvate isomerase N-terminal domain-containing protein [Candidatus Limnocylindrales bacterium]